MLNTQMSPRQKWRAIKSEIVHMHLLCRLWIHYHCTSMKLVRWELCISLAYFPGQQVIARLTFEESANHLWLILTEGSVFTEDHHNPLPTTRAPSEAWLPFTTLRCPALTALNLGANGLDDSGATHLSTVLPNSKIKVSLPDLWEGFGVEPV